MSKDKELFESLKENNLILSLLSRPYSEKTLESFKYLSLNSVELLGLVEERAKKAFGAKFATIGTNEDDLIESYSRILKASCILSESPYKDPKEIKHEGVNLLVLRDEPSMDYIDYKRIKESAKNSKMKIVVVVNYETGLTVSGLAQNPVFHADLVVVSLRGMTSNLNRAIALTNDEVVYNELKKYTKSVDRYLLAPHATILKEITEPFFSVYARKCVQNANALLQEFIKLGYSSDRKETSTNYVLLNVDDAENKKHLLLDKGIVVSVDEHKSKLVFDTAYTSYQHKSKDGMKEYARKIDKILKNEF